MCLSGDVAYLVKPQKRKNPQICLSDMLSILQRYHAEKSEFDTVTTRLFL